MAYLTYEKIGEELNISKQTVSILYKQGLNKLFTKLRKELSPYDTLKAITITFDIHNHDDFKQMFKGFNSNIKQEIENDPEYRQQKIEH